MTRTGLTRVTGTIRTFGTCYACGSTSWRPDTGKTRIKTLPVDEDTGRERHPPIYKESRQVPGTPSFRGSGQPASVSEKFVVAEKDATGDPY
jgi:hypothetical protein